jgi:hypothetical protein
MLSFVDAVARYVLAGPPEPALWAIRVRGQVVGLLVSEQGGRRLSWFADADQRLASYAGPLDGDIEALAAALGARLGRQVELETLPG